MAKVVLPHTITNTTPAYGSYIQENDEALRDGVNNIDSDQITAGAVTSDKIADNAVTTSKIQDSAITSSKILDGSVTTLKIANDAVVTAKIADGAVTAAKVEENLRLWFEQVSGNLADGNSIQLSFTGYSQVMLPLVQISYDDGGVYRDAASDEWSGSSADPSKITYNYSFDPNGNFVINIGNHSGNSITYVCTVVGIRSV